MAPAPNAAPVFPDSETGARSVAEDAAASADIGDPVAATDPDGDTLTYSLGGSDASSFTIDSATGQLSAGASLALDYEARSSYAVTVTATDPSAASATQTVTVTVTNVDEAGSVSFSASPQAGAALTASLTDPDGSLSSTSWAWASATSASGTFTDITGATSASYTPTSGDVGNWLQATASYADGHGSSKTARAVASAPVAPKPNETAPAFVSAAVNGTSLVLIYDEALNENSTPAPDDYAVTVGGTAAPVVSGGVSVSGRAVTLTLASAVTHGQAVTLDYTPGTNPVQDEAGNDAAALTNKTVTNNTPAVIDTTAPDSELPTETVLFQNHPNPFNPYTSIDYALSESGSVRLTIYDLLGREQAVLFDGFQRTGLHRVRFEARGLPSGPYVYRLETPQGALNRTMLLLK